MKPFMIILEGPDGAGKSTLATHLVDLHKVGLYHFDSKSSLTDYAWPMLVDTSEVIVFDRAWQSDEAYKKIRKDQGRIKLWQRSMLEGMAVARNCIVVYCLPLLDILRLNYDKNGDDFITKEDLNDLCVEYYKIYANEELPKILFDYTRHNYLELVQEIMHTTQQ